MISFESNILRWRRPVLVTLTLVTLVFTACIPGLTAVFAPEELVPPRPDEEARADRLLAGFEGREVPVLLLLQASGPEGMLAENPLRYLHGAARHFARESWTARVEALTTTPLPRAADPDVGEDIDLDMILDEVDPLEPVLGRLIATDLDRFPMGMLSLAERTGGRLTLGPLVDEELGPEELARVRSGARATPIRGRFVSPDARSALVAVVPRGEGASTEAVEAARAWLEANPPPPGVRAELAGLPVVREAMVESLQRDQLLLVGLAVFGSLLVLALGFRSWAGVLLPLGAAGMTSGIVVGAMAALGEPINLLNNVVPPLLITVGLGDAVHLVVRYREELAGDGDRLEAARRTVRAMASACFLTTLTTAVGFGSLVVSETEVVRRFGITAALGVALAYVVTIGFLPAALPGFRLAPASRARRGALDEGLWRLTELALRRPGPIVGLALALMVASVALGSRVRVDSALLDHIDPDSDVAGAVARLEEGLGGVRRVEVVLAGARGRYHGAAGLGELAALTSWLEARPGVLQVEGASPVLGALWAYVAGPDAAPAFADPTRAEALAELGRRSAPSLWARYVSADGSRARLEVQLANQSERALNALFDEVEAHLATLPVESIVAGEAHRSARGLDRLVQDLLPSLAVAVLIIFILLGLLFRSWRLAFASVLPNLLPLAAALAYMALRGIPLHAGTAIVFTVSIGLVVDGTIHVLARHREEARAGVSNEEALRRAVQGSGRAVVIGALTMALGFAALLFASFVPIRWFAELSLVAILIALPADLVLLPALLALRSPRPPARGAPTHADPSPP